MFDIPKKTILIDENIPFLDTILRQSFEIIKFNARELTAQKLIDSNCFALFVRSTTKVNQDLLEDTAVQFVATATSGSEHIDKEYLLQNNIFFAVKLYFPAIVLQVHSQIALLGLKRYVFNFV